MMHSPGWTPASDENAMPPGEASIDSAVEFQAVGAHELSRQAHLDALIAPTLQRRLFRDAPRQGAYDGVLLGFLDAGPRAATRPKGSLAGRRRRPNLNGEGLRRCYAPAFLPVSIRPGRSPE